MTNLFPGLAALRAYTRRAFLSDVAAGLSVTAILVPQCMAYGTLAGVQPIYGLYAALAAMPVYFLLSTSRHLVVGPEASSAIMAATIIAPLAAGSPERYALLMAGLTLFAGIFLLAAGAFRLGFLANFLAKPVLIGYLNGVGLTIIGGQLGRLFGLQVISTNFFFQIAEVASRLDEAQKLTIFMGLAMLAALLLLQRFFPRLPNVPLVVAAATILVGVLHLDQQGVAILGDIPRGLPSFNPPHLSLADITLLVPGALGLTLLIIPDALMSAQGLAMKYRYRVDANKEMVALGGINLISSLLQCFPVGASQSRTVVSTMAGAKSQVSGLVATLLLALVLIFLTHILYFLPYVALAAVVMAAGMRLIDLPATRQLFRLRPIDGMLSVVTTLGMLTVGMLPGLLIAVALDLLFLVQRVARPNDALLGRVSGLDGWHEVKLNDNCETVPGLIVYRFEAQLIFINASYFYERVWAILAAEEDPIQVFLLDAETIPSMDSTAADQLLSLHEELSQRGMVLAIARANPQVRRMLDASGVTERIGEHNIFKTVEQGVSAYLNSETTSQPYKNNPC
jgi:high affinity sulfate transporter 1